jgi:hypothetical protein
MKIYDNIGSLRLLYIKVVLDDKDTIYEGMVEDAPENVKNMRYSKIEIDSDATHLYVYSECN